MAQSRWDSLTLAAKCALARLVVCLPSAVSEYKYFCETLGTADRALVRSVACCDSYWFMILHLWEAESAFCALCDLSFLPRVFLSVSSVEQKILRCAQDDSWTKLRMIVWTKLRMAVRRSVLHLIRSVTAVMLSGAKHLSYHSAPCHFDRALPSCHFARASHLRVTLYYMLFEMPSLSC